MLLKLHNLRFVRTISSLPSSMANSQAAMQRIYKYPVPPSIPENWTPPPVSADHKGRYLWTDAFDVVNFLTLYRETGDAHYRILAQRLVSAVHDTLGYTRDGRSRLPHATDEHPLCGGLRTGKEDETGSDGDGQYHHYLTLWMFALDRLSVASGEQKYNSQVIELAKAMHPAFVYNQDSDRPRMAWKTSTDLSHPLVRSEGNLDPIDGYVTFRLL